MSNSRYKILIDAQANVSKAFAKVNKSLNKTNENIRRLKSSFKNMRNYGAVAFAGITAAVSGTIIKSAQFEKTMSNISTLISGDSLEAIYGLKKGILDMTKVIPIDPNELGAAAYDIVSAGVEGTNQQLKVLKASSKLAVAGLGDAKGGVDLMTSAINAFNLNAEDAIGIADVFFKTVKNGKTTVDGIKQAFGSTAPVIAAAGISLEEFSAMTAAMTTTGMSASIAQTQLKQATIELQKPAEALSGFMFDAGVSSEMLADKNIGLMGVMEKLKSHSDETGIGFAKVFGSAEALNAAILATDKTIRRKMLSSLDDMREGANSMGEAFDKQTATMSAQWTMFKNTMESSTIRIGDTLATQFVEPLKKLMTAIGEVTEKIVIWIEKNPKLTKWLIIISGSLAALVTVIGVIGLVLPSVIMGFTMLGTAIAFVSAPVWVIIGLLVIIGLTIRYVINHMDLMKEGWQELVDFMTSKIEQASDWIYSKIILIKDGWNAMKGAIVFAIQQIGKFIRILIKAYLSPFIAVINLAKQAWVSLKTGMIAFAGYVKAGFSSVINGIVSKVTNLIDKIRRAIALMREIGGKTRSRVKKYARNVSEGFKSVKSGLNFANGGFVNAPLGQPVLATVHGGEEIIPARHTGRSGSSINININGGMYTDEQSVTEFTNVLLDRIKTEIRI